MLSTQKFKKFIRLKNDNSRFNNLNLTTYLEKLHKFENGFCYLGFYGLLCFGKINDEVNHETLAPDKA